MRKVNEKYSMCAFHIIEKSFLEIIFNYLKLIKCLTTKVFEMLSPLGALFNYNPIHKPQEDE